MKKIVLLLSLISFSAFADSVTFNVKGMVCSMCAQGIKKKFSAYNITDINVDLDKKFVTLKSDKKIELSDEKITELIKDAGYEVNNLKRQ